MRKRYIIRLDDASEYMDCEKWSRMEALLDKYEVRPIFGIIPDNQDDILRSKYVFNADFWDIIHSWNLKGWIPAMHGYQHKYVTKNGGINPVNKKSEFAGLPYVEQAEKIRKGWEILKCHSIKPDIFFAPSHTFDENTLKAIKEETSIRIISDTVAWDAYRHGEFTFIPQQSGMVRKLPFRMVTFCYHPNTMTEVDFHKLERFLKKYKVMFDGGSFYQVDRKYSCFDAIISMLYFLIRKIRFSTH